MSLASIRKLGFGGAALALAVFCAATSLQAATISISYNHGSNLLAPGDTAGVVAASNWNNSQVTEGVSPAAAQALVDSSGGATSISGKYTASYGPNSNDNTVGSSANAVMMTGAGLNSVGIGGGHKGQIEISSGTGLATDLGGSYDLYIYYGTAYSGNQMGGSGNFVISDTGFTDNVPSDVPTGTNVAYQTFNTDSIGGSGTIVYDDGVGFVESLGAPGNYVKLTGLTLENLVITANYSSGGSYFPTVNIEGIQIVGSAPVPEPSTFALAGLGLVGLVGYGLRRRKK